MKNWKFIQVGNETVGPNWDKKRQLEDELRGWMTMVNKLDGDERRNAEKQIADIRKELNDVKIKIAHGENKKAGNESIDKQVWSMFKGLSKDAEKEVGNKAIVLKDGNVWVVLYANETKSQEFESEEEAREFAKKVGNKQIAGDYYDVVMSGSHFYIYKNGGSQIIGPFNSEQEAQKKIDAIEKERSRTGNETLGQWAKAKPRIINETKGERKFGKVMGEFERGELKSGSGEKVTDPSQAKAIAYSEADKVDNLKRARNAMAKNKQITLWNGNDTVLISEDGIVQYLERNAFETDRAKFESQEKAIEELTKQGYRNK